MDCIENCALPCVGDERSGSSSGDITADQFAVVAEWNVTDDKASGGCSDGSDTFVCSLGCCHGIVVYTRMGRGDRRDFTSV